MFASRPSFFVERISVLTPEALQSATGIRIAVAGLRCVVSCSGLDTIRCEAARVKLVGSGFGSAGPHVPLPYEMNNKVAGLRRFLERVRRSGRAAFRRSRPHG